MKALVQGIKRFVREEDGAAASEYAILVAFVAAAVAAGVSLFGFGTMFTDLGTQVRTLVGTAS